MATPEATLWLGTRALPWLAPEEAAARSAAAEQLVLLALAPPDALRACCSSGCCADAPDAALFGCWAPTEPDAAPPVGPADGPARLPLPAVGVNWILSHILLKTQWYLSLPIYSVPGR